MLTFALTFAVCCGLLYLLAGLTVVMASGIFRYSNLLLRRHVWRHHRLPSRCWMTVQFVRAVLMWPKLFWVMARI